MSFGAWVDIFISDLSDKTNSFVGLVETVRGSVICVMSIVAGFLADKFSRASLLKLSACLMICPILMYAYGIWHEDLTCIAFALPLFAASGQVGQEAQILLLQDCCTDQERVDVLAKKNWAENVALGAGALLQLGMVLARDMRLDGGSDWSLGLLKELLLSGLLIHPIVVILCFCTHHVPPGAASAAIGRNLEAETWRSDLLLWSARRDVLVVAWATSCWIASVMGAGLTLKTLGLGTVQQRHAKNHQEAGSLRTKMSPASPTHMPESYEDLCVQILPVLSFGGVLRWCSGAHGKGQAESCVVFVMLGAIFLVVFALGAGREWMPFPLAAI
eukprot:814418-Amphidinium_carterae.1